MAPVRTLCGVIQEFEIGELMASFFEATLVPIAILDPEHRILVTAGLRDICVLFHRTNSEGAKLCQEVEHQVATHLTVGTHVQYSCRLGLVDVALPIMIDTEHRGTLFIGQFRHEPADREWFRQQALAHGFDVNAYLRALDEVEVIPPDDVLAMMAVLGRLVALLAGLVRESRARAAAKDELCRSGDVLERQVVERTRELREIIDTLAREASHDDLTGLWNRRHLRELLDMEIARSRRSGAEISVLLIDLDRLKEVNDAYGHDAGDRALVRVGSILAEELPAGDVLARWGGDEFLALLPTTTLADAVRVAGRLRRAVECAGGPPGERVTVSIGVTSWLSESAASLLRRGDEALYEAKRQGRNRCVAQGALEPPSGPLPRQRAEAAEPARPA